MSKCSESRLSKHCVSWRPPLCHFAKKTWWGKSARSTKEVLDKLVDGDSVPIALLSHFEVAVPAASPGGDDAQLRRVEKG